MHEVALSVGIFGTVLNGVLLPKSLEHGGPLLASINTVGLIVSIVVVVIGLDDLLETTN